MSANLYLLSNGKALELNEMLYDSEAHLQELIASNPHLLLRDTDPPDSRLMLIAREYTIAESDNSMNSYSLDHLFVDQNGTPVLVEVKRSTDTRIRREVVAQMMDYASRASTWDANALRILFRENNRDEHLLEAYDTDSFWDQVSTCLKAERLKLVFAADKITDSLKTLIEFMDRSMTDIEVYGVEIRQHKNENTTLLSSTIVGNAKVNHRRAVRSSIEWTSASLFSFLTSRGEQSLIPIIQDILSYSESIGLSSYFGRGSQQPTLAFKLNDIQIFCIMGWSKKSKGDICTAEICIRDLLESLPNGSWCDENIRTLFSHIPGGETAETTGLIWNTKDYLYIDLRAFLDKNNLSYFKSALKEFTETAMQS